MIKSHVLTIVFCSLFVSALQAQSWEKAIQGQQEIIEIFLTDIQESFEFLAEAEQQKYVNRYRYNLDMHLGFCYSFSSRFPELGGDAMNLSLATKGMILNTGREMRRAILNSGDTAAIQLYYDWTELKEKIAYQYTLPESKRLRGLPSMEKRVVQYEKDLYRIASAANGLPELLGTRWQDVKASLTENEVAIEFSHFKFYNGEDWTDSVVYVAFVLRANDEWPHLVELFEEKELSHLLKNSENLSESDFIDFLYGFPEEGIDDPESMIGQLLHQKIWKPLETHLLPHDTIYYAPSGLLHLINPDALPYSLDSVVAEKYTLIRLNTTGFLKTRNQNLQELNTMALFGGIDYEKNTMTARATDLIADASPAFEPSGRAQSTWNYLPGSKAEVESIATFANTFTDSVIIFQGADAPEEAFKRLSGSKGSNVVHVATHGFFLDDIEEVVADNMFQSAENPLLRSGLLFSGGGVSWNSDVQTEGIEDGILTALEVANTDLSGFQLVVLSACNTGLGTIEAGEGVYGLQRSFKMAGVEYLLMSLWEVPDIQTAQYMQEFYKHLFETNNVHKAHQITNNTMRNKYSAPYYWAGFVLIR